MNAQNCEARLKFKSFKVKIPYEVKQTLHNYFYDVTETITGTWEIDLFTDFTKRELACPNLLFLKKRQLEQDGIGWAHKALDAPIMRDFSMGYPFPAWREGEGYEYPAEYYANQKYPNQTTPNPNPNLPPVPVPPEPVPLLDNLRKRQSLIPIINSASGDGPFYYKVEDEEDPLYGYPPNWPKVIDFVSDEEVFKYILSPDQTVFSSKKDYTKWLATWLDGLKTPVYYPGAPNDPEPDANPRTIKTLFNTKKAWMDFLNGAGGRGTICGGNAQCGFVYKIPNRPSGELPPSLTYTGTASGAGTGGTTVTWGETIKRQPTTLAFSRFPFRTSEEEVIQDQYYRPPKIDAIGNLKYKTWQKWNSPYPDNFSAYQTLETVFYSHYFFQYFNANQPGCRQFRETYKNIPSEVFETDGSQMTLDWIFIDKNNLIFEDRYESEENAFEVFCGYTNGYPPESWPPLAALQTGLTDKIIAIHSGSFSWNVPSPAPEFNAFGDVKIDVTFEMEWENL